MDGTACQSTQAGKLSPCIRAERHIHFAGHAGWAHSRRPSSAILASTLCCGGSGVPNEMCDPGARYVANKCDAKKHCVAIRKSIAHDAIGCGGQHEQHLVSLDTGGECVCPASPLKGDTSTTRSLREDRVVGTSPASLLVPGPPTPRCLAAIPCRWIQDERSARVPLMASAKPSAQ